MSASTLETLLKNSVYWELSESLNSLCVELLEDLGINYFDYARFYKTGKFFILFNDKDYFKFVLNAAKGKRHDYYKPPTDYLQTGKHLWQTYINPYFLDEASKVYRHYQGVTIIKHGKEYNEVINFSAPQDNTDIIDVYQNHDFILDIFTSAVKDKFNSIINKPRHHLQLPQNLLSIEENIQLEKLQLFLNKAKRHFKSRKNQVILPWADNVIFISKSELVCLELILTGLSNKEIARTMEISSRTVEVYCANLIKKTQTNSKQQLISISKADTVKALKKLC